MSTGNLTGNLQEFFLKYPTNEKAARVSQTRAAADRTTTSAEFTENSPKYHPAPIVYVVPVRDPSGFWPLHVKQCPYCNGHHTHGGGNGHMPLWGHRVAHCVVGAPGYILVGVDCLNNKEQK